LQGVRGCCNDSDDNANKTIAPGDFGGWLAGWLATERLRFARLRSTLVYELLADWLITLCHRQQQRDFENNTSFSSMLGRPKSKIDWNPLGRGWSFLAPGL